MITSTTILLLISDHKLEANVNSFFLSRKLNNHYHKNFPYPLLQSKSMDWFLYDTNLSYESVRCAFNAVASGVFGSRSGDAGTFLKKKGI